MSEYPYVHAKGSLLYKSETYKFRYRGIAAATIELIDVPEEEFAFQFEIQENNMVWPNLPNKFKQPISNNDSEILKELEMDGSLGLFKTKVEALQTAINMIEIILNKYRKQGGS